MTVTIMRRNEPWALKMYLGVMDLMKQTKIGKSCELGAFMRVSPPLLVQVRFQIWPFYSL